MTLGHNIQCMKASLELYTTTCYFNFHALCLYIYIYLDLFKSCFPFNHVYHMLDEINIGGTISFSCVKKLQFTTHKHLS